MGELTMEKKTVTNACMVYADYAELQDLLKTKEDSQLPNVQQNAQAVESGNVPEKTTLSIAQYMGAHMKRELRPCAIFLSTNQEEKPKAIQQLISSLQRVVLLSWLLECWAHRDEFDFVTEKITHNVMKTSTLDLSTLAAVKSRKLMTNEVGDFLM
ncbi:unnamed protein product [Angiostrongylus costaricensis]|uniref:Dynein_heavy domain-containing protein n=1 Tax=Angiostrongylus costaricensis TaxID=334426 RepID=A0A0R3PU29_ANGCS|nr:unnamed protein product [Angiostrongylus costaricensis]